ncbi:MAG: hypothetical protein JNN15_05065 [Blastocatellia bacterium]|nr:hypothetical protein [Blastocatellia bacterium]
MSQSRVGQEIEAFCGRCRMDRTHRIVAQDPDGSIKKVICGMCNSYRNYKQPSPRSTTKRAASRTSTSTVVEEKLFPSRNYNMKESYKEGEVIAHPTFGVGKVLSERDQHKIEVKFADGIRILLQNR